MYHGQISIAMVITWIKEGLSIIPYYFGKLLIKQPSYMIVENMKWLVFSSVLLLVLIFMTLSSKTESVLSDYSALVSLNFLKYCSFLVFKL
jgi:hypothetical protein